jgi:hypothetical protein
VSVAGAKALRHQAAVAEVRDVVKTHAAQVADAMADEFREVYARCAHRARVAEYTAAILQTAIELIAAGCPGTSDPPEQVAQAALDQLGITPDIQTSDGG